jgi:hypothetical protein
MGFENKKVDTDGMRAYFKGLCVKLGPRAS